MQCITWLKFDLKIKWIVQWFKLLSAFVMSCPSSVSTFSHAHMLLPWMLTHICDIFPHQTVTLKPLTGPLSESTKSCTLSGEKGSCCLLLLLTSSLTYSILPLWASFISLFSFVWHLFQTQNPIRSLWSCVLAVVLTSSATLSYLAMCLAHNTCHCTSNRPQYTCCCCSLHWSINNLPVILFTWLDCDLGQTWRKFLFQIDWK